MYKSEMSNLNSKEKNRKRAPLNIDLINDKMTEIGQRTKTFCTIFDSEVVGYNRKLQDTITIMDSMKNMKM